MYRFLIVVLALSFIVGCSRQYSYSTNESGDAEAYPERPAILSDNSLSFDAKNSDGADLSGDAISQLVSKTTQDNQPAVARKIIYTADLQIVVEDFSSVPQSIKQLVEQHEGFIASENLDRMRGEHRSGYWTARIPVSKYSDFIEAVSNLGVPTSQIQNAQDVTEEFVDIQARIENKKKLEQRIIQLLERPDDKIQHVIEVERELARVREDIERMEGRLRYLQDRTTMTTVTIRIREEKNYQPPQVPTLSNRVSSAWTNSLDNTRTFLENSLVFLVGNAIGLVLGFLALVLGFLILRRLVKKLFGAASS